MKDLFSKMHKNIANRYSLPILALLAVLTLLFVGVLLFGGEHAKDIFLVLMIWCLPLFLH